MEAVDASKELPVISLRRPYCDPLGLAWMRRMDANRKLTLLYAVSTYRASLAPRDLEDLDHFPAPNPSETVRHISFALYP